MKIAATYSHLNGLEYLLVHKPKLWNDVQHVIADIDAIACRTKVSKERRMAGKLKFSPKAMNREFRARLKESQWEESRVTYWVTKTEKLNPRHPYENCGGSEGRDYCPGRGGDSQL